MPTSRTPRARRCCRGRPDANPTWRVGHPALLRGVVRFCGRFARRRYVHLVSGPRGGRIVGSLMAVAGLLMAIPFFGIPFNDTLPALVIIAACIAELEDDGGL